MIVDGLWRNEMNNLLISIHSSEMNTEGLYPGYTCHVDVLKGDPRDLNPYMPYMSPTLQSVIPKKDFKIAVQFFKTTFKTMGREFLLEVIEAPELRVEGLIPTSKITIECR